MLGACMCLAAALLVTQLWAGSAAAPPEIVALYTRVPYTPPAALADVPASYTPDPRTPLSNSSAVGTLHPTPLPSDTPDLAARATESDNALQGSQGTAAVPGVGTGTAIPTASATRRPTVTPAGSPPPATAAPTPTTAPTAIIATSTAAPLPTATPRPTATLVPQPTAVPRNPKKGIAAAYAWAFEDGHVPFRISWYYTWSLYPGAWASDPDLEFIPLWPCNGTVDYVVGLLGSSYSGYLLIMNEPDNPNQCVRTIDEAAQHYLMVRGALPNAKIIGPQVILPGANGNFTDYTAAWRERVRALTGSYPLVHGYGVHIYPYYEGSGTATEVLTDWCDALNAWGEVGTKELWVTEFGVHNFDGTPDEVRTQVRQMVDVFENGVGNCEIDRYAYFTDRRENVDADSPTPTIEPIPEYFDLYWRNSWLLSYTGEAYRDAGNP